MLATYAEAALGLNRDDYREVSERNAEFLLRELRQEAISSAKRPSKNQTSYKRNWHRDKPGCGQPNATCITLTNVLS
jgi:hypothetical protein